MRPAGRTYLDEEVVYTLSKEKWRSVIRTAKVSRATANLKFPIHEPEFDGQIATFRHYLPTQGRSTHPITHKSSCPDEKGT